MQSPIIRAERHGAHGASSDSRRDARGMRLMPRRAKSPPSLTILAWHNIAPTPFFAGYPKGFHRQLKLVRRLGNVVPLAAALEALREGRSLGPRAVAITFDDGYRDNLDVAVPMLRGLDMPATFFLVPGYLDRTARCWWETVAWALGRSRLGHIHWRGRSLPAAPSPGWRDSANIICGDLKSDTHDVRDAAIGALIERLQPAGSEAEVAELFLDWEGARGLPEWIGVGSHTNEHPILARESADYQRAHLAGSRRTLASELGVPVDVLAYPNGGLEDYDDTTIDAARAAGYRGAVTTRDGHNGSDTPAYELRRFVVSSRWDPGMIRYLMRIFMSARRGVTA